MNSKALTGWIEVSSGIVSRFAQTVIEEIDRERMEYREKASEIRRSCIAKARLQKKFRSRKPVFPENMTDYEVWKRIYSAECLWADSTNTEFEKNDRRSQNWRKDQREECEILIKLSAGSSHVILTSEGAKLINFSLKKW